MMSRLCLSLLSFVVLAATTHAGAPSVSRSSDTQSDYEVCAQIAQSISSKSAVFYPGNASYEKDISHYFNSSAQSSNCSVEPGTPADVGIILNILGSTRTQFAVKGGGHASSQGFSSTAGVQIAMSRFSEVIYNSTSQSVTVGSGLLWDDVYAALGPHNVTAVGGRVSGIGVAGFALGGGYSWKTNQYGLTVDNILAFELVTPGGKFATVTEKSDPELFSGLKGGYNNFGIVTRFMFRTVPQGLVWGGTILVNGTSNIDAVAAATVQFAASSTDPKAGLIVSFSSVFGQGLASVLLFYDNATPPAGIFDDFLDIPSLQNDISTRDYLSLIQSSPSNPALGSRGNFQTVPLLNYSSGLLDFIINETRIVGPSQVNKSGVYISYSTEPFLPTILSHNNSPSAYPADRSIAYSPFNMDFNWNDETFDGDFHDAISESANRIHDFAIAEGQNIGSALLYPNYALSDTPLESMYGQPNLARLRRLKDTIDPSRIMDLAGGFKF